MVNTPQFSNLSRIDGRGLVQVIVSSLHPFYWIVARDGKILESHQLKDLMILIEANLSPAGDLLGGRAIATLCFQANNIAGREEVQSVNLFPGTVDIVVHPGYRITVVNTDGSIEGTQIFFGLDEEGNQRFAENLKGISILLSREMMEAKATFLDGRTEKILPTDPPSFN